MKYVKCISLFVVYPLLVLGIGFYVGVKSSRYFYPEVKGEEAGIPQENASEGSAQKGQASFPEGQAAPEETGQTEASDRLAELPETAEDLEEVMVSAETLCVDTKYVLEETDVLYHTVVETTWKLPDKYVGMNREQFLQAMEVYEIGRAHV